LKYKKINISDFKNDNLNIEDFPFLIETPLLTFSIIITSSLILILVYVVITYSSDYIFPSIILFSFLGYDLWKNLEPINVVKVNVSEKFFHLSSKNPLKFLFVGTKKYLFKEISKISFSEESGSRMPDKHYIIFAILKNSKRIILTQSLDKDAAQKAAASLNEIIQKG
jgi:hypothetical protein